MSDSRKGNRERGIEDGHRSSTPCNGCWQRGGCCRPRCSCRRPSCIAILMGTARIITIGTATISRRSASPRRQSFFRTAMRANRTMSAANFHQHGCFRLLGTDKYYPSPTEPCGSQDKSPCNWEMTIAVEPAAGFPRPRLERRRGEPLGVGSRGRSSRGLRLSVGRSHRSSVRRCRCCAAV